MNISELAQVREPPLLSEHPVTWELLSLTDIHRLTPEREQVFWAAMWENTRWHFERNERYRAYCESLGVAPLSTLRESDDPLAIPAVWADILKSNDLATLKGPDLMTVSSSGTSGRPTQVTLDAETVIRMWRMGRTCFEEDGLVSEVPVHYVLFAPDPATSGAVGNAHFFTALIQFAPAADTTYALSAGADGSLHLDLPNTEDALARAAESGEPVRMIGLPALMAAVARPALPHPMSLHEDSLVLTGGGWKDAAQERIPKEEFRDLLHAAWQLPPERVRDLYGMTEHAVHYLECPSHRFHAPAFSRVRVIDPLNGRPVPDGELGVLHLMNPAFTTMPVQSLVTADVGRGLGECECGRKTPAFEVVGRAGQLPHRGCAATTLERVVP